MSDLLPCPCGNIPEKLGIEVDHKRAKWAKALCPCGDWSIEFRNQYLDIESKESQERAAESWNEASRMELKAVPKSLAEKAEGFDWLESCEDVDLTKTVTGFKMVGIDKNGQPFCRGRKTLLECVNKAREELG